MTLAARRKSVGWTTAFLDAPWIAMLPSAASLRSLAHFPTPDELNERLTAPVRFVRPPARRERARTRLYEYRAAMDGEVLTRADSWHDLFNALVWATFPATKLALTQRLCAAQQHWLADGATRLPGARLGLQDRLAMFDEGGLVRRGDELVWFGHALYEHRWLLPTLPLRGSLLTLPTDDGALDPTLAALVPTAVLSERLPTAAL